MSDMDLDDVGFDNLDVDDLIKLEQVEHSYLSDPLHQPSRMSMSIPPESSDLANSQIIELESQLRNSRHKTNQMEKKVQEQQEVTKRKDLEILELKRQLSMLRPKAVTEKRAFPAEKPAPRKIYKRSTHSPKQSQSSSVDQPVAVVPPSVQLPVNENQENYKLLRVLYSDIFIEWNNKNHNGTKDFESCVHHTELIDMFVSQCMPESHESNVTLDQFGLMADQIKHTIQDSKQPHQTIPILLHQLHFCLSISIENRLYKTIQHLSNIIHRLTCAFIEAKEYMYQELMLYPPSSLVYTMANALSLFRFTQLPPEISILDNHPDIQNNNNISFTRIMELAELYNMLPSQICSLIDAEKTPDETLDTVKSILESFIHLGLTYQEPLFVFLLTHEGFLELISTATPWLVLMKACHVLNTNYVDKQWSDIEWRSDKPLKAIQKLFDLLDIPGASIGKEKMYQLRIDTLGVIHNMCKVNLPLSTLSSIQREAYTKSMDLMRIETVEMKKSLKLNEQKMQASFIAEIFATIHTVLKRYQGDLLEYYEQYDDYNLHRLSALVVYMLDHIEDDHRARLFILAIEQLLNKIVQSQQN